MSSVEDETNPAHQSDAAAHPDKDGESATAAKPAVGTPAAGNEETPARPERATSSNGTTKRMTLKIKAAPKPSEKAAPRPQPAVNRAFKGHILIVEDNELNQMLIKIYLDNIGLTYDCANNGEQAIAAVRANEYDIILMDIMMPVMDGVTATKEIRAGWAEGEEVPIIALSANALEEQIDEYYQAGMRGYVSKPIRCEDFYKIIAALLEERRATEAAAV